MEQPWTKLPLNSPPKKKGYYDGILILTTLSHWRGQLRDNNTLVKPKQNTSNIAKEKYIKYSFPKKSMELRNQRSPMTGAVTEIKSKTYGFEKSQTHP